MWKGYLWVVASDIIWLLVRYTYITNNMGWRPGYPMTWAQLTISSDHNTQSKLHPHPDGPAVGATSCTPTLGAFCFPTDLILHSPSQRDILQSSPCLRHSSTIWRSEFQYYDLCNFNGILYSQLITTMFSSLQPPKSCHILLLSPSEHANTPDIGRATLCHYMWVRHIKIALLGQWTYQWSYISGSLGSLCIHF